MLFMHADPFLLAIQSNGHQCLAHLAWVANHWKLTQMPTAQQIGLEKQAHSSINIPRPHMTALLPQGWCQRGNCTDPEDGKLSSNVLAVGDRWASYASHVLKNIGLTPISCEGGMHGLFASDVMCSIGCITVWMLHGIMGIGPYGHTWNSCRAVPCHAPSCIQEKDLAMQMFLSSKKGHASTSLHSIVTFLKHLPNCPPIFCVLRVWAELLQTQVLHHWCHLIGPQIFKSDKVDESICGFICHMSHRVRSGKSHLNIKSYNS